MASVDKFTDEAMDNMLAHNNRKVANPTNKDIDKERSKLNYTFELNHGGLSEYEYYKKLLNEKYLYGRGTKREKEAITGCGWIVTLPQEIYGYPDKEKAFFKAVFDFICGRYGKENVINSVVHYDEAGLPHIHTIFCPVTKLDHDIVQHKTVKTSKAVKLESGRYEYEYRFKLDESGEKIKLNNYARMTDYYEEKIDCNSVLNKAELMNFHKDLQAYLTANGIEGAVLNGKTGGVNISVKGLKDFTEKTGLHIEDIKSVQGDKNILESLAEYSNKVDILEKDITEKDKIINQLKEEIKNNNTVTEDLMNEIKALKEKNIDLESKLEAARVQKSDKDVWTEKTGWSSDTQRHGWSKSIDVNN